MRVTPLVWVSLGLVSLTFSVMLAGHSLVNLVPNDDQLTLEYRRNLAESLAIQYSALVEQDQMEALKFSLATVVERNSDIMSAALLRTDKTVLAEAGNHIRLWGQPKDDRSTLDFLQIPIYSNDQPWGVLQIGFRPTSVSGFQWLVTSPWARFLAFVTFSGFLCYLFFIKHTLRQLDPSAVIPARVKAALDALTQGVAMIDSNESIVLANESFSQAVGDSVTSMIGRELSSFSWHSDNNSTDPSMYPWIQALKEKKAIDRAPLLLECSNGESRKFIVNTVPIMDDESTINGALVSFHDVTELDRMNTQLKEVNNELESSRVQILKTNQELVKTNNCLHVEINQRKKAEEEKESLYQQLMQASRQAGMADVASSVLHNVGNVLNSINVSTDTLLKTLRKPMVGDVCRIASMFNEHQSNLQEFLTMDPKGKQIPGYLSLVAESLSGSHQAIQSELDSLVQKVDHIKHVILSQQDIARAGTVREVVKADDLMEQALMMVIPEPEKYRFDVIREFSQVPKFMTDRHQVLQILVNVITNAKNAMVEYPGPKHRLTLRIGSGTEGTGSVRFEIIDTGRGILAEHLPRLFTQGFTTRKEGHGLGLHSAAISAKCVGGSIKAYSEGDGRGARFTVELPLVLAEAAA